jgi:hypothetical protein
MNNQQFTDPSANKKVKLVTQYLATKNSQIQAKFGIATDSDSKEFLNNYTLCYVKDLAEEWVQIITKSIACSFKVYFNALLRNRDSEFSTSYSQFLFRVVSFYLHVIRLNDVWNGLALTQHYLDILAGVITLTLYPSTYPTVNATLCFLLISILSKSNTLPNHRPRYLC